MIKSTKYAVGNDLLISGNQNNISLWVPILQEGVKKKGKKRKKKERKDKKNNTLGKYEK
jgi:hypothetical protein